jgi:DNA invertase Pin-like site-specific DNA recombinase
VIGVYIRVSSQSQKADSQRVEIEQYLKRHRIENAQWFEDKESGKTLKRPGLQALQDAIFRGEIDTVIVWKLDRLARSFREGVGVVTEWCQKGIRLISVTQQIDLAGTVGQMVAGVLFAFAEMELQHSKERQAAGIALARERGIYKGRKKGTTKATPERAKELKAKGLTHDEIAAALSVTKRTVANYLKD